MSGWGRAALWTAGLPVIALPAFWIGRNRYQGRGEGGLAALNGYYWSFIATMAYIFVVLLVEVTLYVRRRR